MGIMVTLRTLNYGNYGYIPYYGVLQDTVPPGENTT